MTEPNIRRWGTHRVTLILLRLLVLAALIATAIAPMLWPTIPGTLLFLAGAMRYELRLTDDELICRELIGATRIPRTEIAYAKFDYKPFGVYLDIHRHNGQIDHLRFAPKASSTELSGDPPTPDSAAYQITRWAQGDG
ncbi:hypothetical protein EV645_0176 [Kribbella rubisoli]|uniref:PH (Pleckstrin Homology) domain-containing protein n=1 Tax=Kribbella rubisoli TaxID=3075929 RepID=A0A4Q7XN74_9ACTN|nr:hypothetical protein [Kribbella rubisoli]RZU24533.1 hypothetical protein EV645_0176 [Kribbella rubisoli]